MTEENATTAADDMSEFGKFWFEGPASTIRDGKLESDGLMLILDSKRQQVLYTHTLSEACRAQYADDDWSRKANARRMVEAAVAFGLAEPKYARAALTRCAEWLERPQSPEIARTNPGTRAEQAS